MVQCESVERRGVAYVHGAHGAHIAVVHVAVTHVAVVHSCVVRVIHVCLLLCLNQGKICLVLLFRSMLCCDWKCSRRTVDDDNVLNV